MKTKKTLIVNGEKVELELRLCANHGCEREFWAAVKSTQSICGISCWEFANHRVWRRNEKKPRIRRPGDRRRKKNKIKKMRRGADYFRKITDADWALRIAKSKASAKGSLVPGSHPQVAKSR